MRQAVIEMTRSIVACIVEEPVEQRDENFEVELLTYQEQRSFYLAECAKSGHGVDGSILDVINSEVLNLEAKLESTRRCSQVAKIRAAKNPNQ